MNHPPANKHVVLLTGATGFLGTYCARELIRRGSHIIALVRPAQGALGRSPEKRLERLWDFDPELKAALGSKVTCVAGDISLPGLGLTAEDEALIASQVSAIVHTAAEVGIKKGLDRLHTINVKGTAHVLDLATRINQLHPLKRFVHVSTAYVAGASSGPTPEEPVSPNSFNSLYEQTKHQAEKLVLAKSEELNTIIIRPAQIVGDSSTGRVFAFNTLYYPLKLYLRGTARLIPASRSIKLNLVPVDYVARIAIESIDAHSPSGDVVHAVLPHSELPTLGQFVDAVYEWCEAKRLGKLKRPVFLPLPFTGSLGRQKNNADVSGSQKSLLSNLLALAPYFNDSHVFASDKALKLGGTPPRWRDFLPQLLEYAVHYGFLNHTGRTAFEQMQVRLASDRNRITYHDLSRESEQRVPHQEMRDRIRYVAAAMLAHGIQRENRVALVGVNSSPYVAVDSAIGLIGATSVPLYYTASYEEVSLLVAQSKARMLFVGSPRMAKAIRESDIGVPCVLLPHAGIEYAKPANAEAETAQPTSSAPENGALTFASSIVYWKDFLAEGQANLSLLEQAPAADLYATATIRYTSGTTGNPKGVTFNHRQLAWMGETMPAILDWNTRTHPIRYLSFLPMSHVVEGILVAYAPYYALTDVDIYCLTEFDALTDMLPKVRPTIFFSVPRFYEKVWAQFQATGAGKRYLSMPEGPAKRLFGKICKKVILKKAGLDACNQLIVGSAPISMDLLEAFRGLGIEIHNAFGLTEAPLITLNRLGQNDLGSLGQPLPETEVAISDEGEILIKGPQLTLGYDGVATPLRNAEGYFATGDLGRWSNQGNLVIDGRSKDLVITSYGKNVQPEKVEALVKGIPGVSEAMLIGNARPYVAVMVWLEDPVEEAKPFEDFDQAMTELQSRLSHAEMPKRWIILRDAPAISRKELTPNLKLRRGQICENHADAVEALYAPEAQLESISQHVDGFIHLGALR